MAAWLGDCVVSLCNTYEEQAGSKYSTSFNYCVLIKNFQTSKLQELDLSKYDICAFKGSNLLEFWETAQE